MNAHLQSEIRLNFNVLWHGTCTLFFQPKQKRAVTWVTSSFDDFGPMSLTASQPSNKPTRAPSKPAFSQTQTTKQSASATQRKISDLMPEEKSQASSSHGSRKRPHGSFPAHRLPSLIKTHTQRHKFKSAISSELWFDKYLPKKRVIFTFTFCLLHKF